ncbi:hypothetical protein BHF72_1367 [Cloacibacterium normanense]|jgi:hypothetical protein|uniref:Uncharacterized protein n=1 Tax=Cloacibacterium normanense TaxID=237258 RepID=A0A1E5UH43_9FLAO|nr:hypothetical protein BHF72_1367 [Cloacibacterium normanense]
MEVGSQKSEVKKLTIFFRAKTIIKILIFNKLKQQKNFKNIL